MPTLLETAMNEDTSFPVEAVRLLSAFRTDNPALGSLLSRRDVDLIDMLTDIMRSSRSSGEVEERLVETATDVEETLGPPAPVTFNDRVCFIMNRCEEFDVDEIYFKIATGNLVEGEQEALQDIYVHTTINRPQLEPVEFIRGQMQTVVERLREYSLDGEGVINTGPYQVEEGHWCWNITDDSMVCLRGVPEWVPALVSTQATQVVVTKIVFPTEQIFRFFVRRFGVLLSGGSVIMVEDLEDRILRITHEDTFSPYQIVNVELEYHREGAEWCAFHDTWTARQSLIKNIERRMWRP